LWSSRGESTASKVGFYGMQPLTVE